MADQTTNQNVIETTNEHGEIVQQSTYGTYYIINNNIGMFHVNHLIGAIARAEWLAKKGTKVELYRVKANAAITDKVAEWN